MSVWALLDKFWLPSRPAIAIVLRFAPGFVRPEEATLRRITRECGYVIAGGSFSVNFEQGQLKWRLSWRSWTGWQSFTWPMRATDGWAAGCPAG